MNEQRRFSDQIQKCESLLRGLGADALEIEIAISATSDQVQADILRFRLNRIHSYQVNICELCDVFTILQECAAGHDSLPVADDGQGGAGVGPGALAKTAGGQRPC